jgi:RNase H-fold protein (predicted Holliday junction resolvase)
MPLTALQRAGFRSCIASTVSCSITNREEDSFAVGLASHPASAALEVITRFRPVAEEMPTRNPGSIAFSDPQTKTVAAPATMWTHWREMPMDASSMR